MELLGIILSAIAAIAAVATLWFSVRTSKGNIHKRIKRKEEQIREIDNELIHKYPTFPHQYITRLCFLVPGHP